MEIRFLTSKFKIAPKFYEIFAIFKGFLNQRLDIRKNTTRSEWQFLLL